MTRQQDLASASAVQPGSSCRRGTGAHGSGGVAGRHGGLAGVRRIRHVEVGERFEGAAELLTDIRHVFTYPHAYIPVYLHKHGV